MKDVLKLSIITPVCKVFDQEVASVNVPGKIGYLGIYPGHSPLVTMVNSGELKITDTSKNKIVIKIQEGFMEVLNDVVTVLTETAENVQV